MAASSKPRGPNTSRLRPPRGRGCLARDTVPGVTGVRLTPDALHTTGNA